MTEVVSGSKDGVVFWDARNLEAKRSSKPFEPSGAEVSSLSWSSNNHRLCVVPKNGDKIALCELQGEEAPKWTQLSKEGVRFTCGCFMSNSHYLLTGSTDSHLSVCIWDRQKQTVVRNFKVGVLGHSSAVTAVARNANDSLVVSGGADGSVLLHNASTGQLVAPLTRDVLDQKPVCQLKFSPFERAMVASASEGGLVCLWSVESQRLLSKLSPGHTGQADVCFSPCNKLLMVSAGMDCKIHCYDVEQRKSVTKLTAPVPLSSVAVLRDGTTLVGGGIDGNLYVYELRSVKNPPRVIKAHGGPITCLSEQHSHKTAGRKRSSKGLTPVVSAERLGERVPPGSGGAGPSTTEGLVVHTPFGIPPPPFHARLAGEGEGAKSYGGPHAHGSATGTGDAVAGSLSDPQLTAAANKTPAAAAASDGTAFATPANQRNSPALFSPLETEQYPVKPAVAALANRRPNGPVGSDFTDDAHSSQFPGIFSPLEGASAQPPLFARPLEGRTTSDTLAPLHPRFATTPSKTPPSSLHERLELRESSLLRRSDANGISRDSQGERGSEHTPGVDERNCQGIERTDTSVPDDGTSPPGPKQPSPAAPPPLTTTGTTSSSSTTNHHHRHLLSSHDHFPPPPSSPLPSSFPQLQHLESLVKDLHEELRHSLHRDIRALSTDMFRQFFVQQQQFSKALSSLNEKVEALSQENKELRKELNLLMPKH